MMEPESAITFLTCWSLGIAPSVAQLAYAHSRVQRHLLLDDVGRAALHESAHAIVGYQEGLQVRISLDADGKTGRCFIEGDERAQVIAALAGPACDLLLGVTVDRTEQPSQLREDFDLARRCVQACRSRGDQMSERDLAKRSVAAVRASMAAIERCANALRIWGDLQHDAICAIYKRAQ